MAFTFVQKNGNRNETGSNITTLAVSLTGVAAGNFIGVFVKFEGASTTCTVSDGTDTLTARAQYNHSAGGDNGQFFYLASSSSGNKTYTMTLGAGRPYVRIYVFEYSYTGTVSFDTEINAEAGSSSAVSSGNITTTGTDELCLALYAENSAVTISSQQINGSAADQIQSGGTYGSAWTKVFTATFTGAATATLSAAGKWICMLVAFKTGAAAADPEGSLIGGKLIRGGLLMHGVLGR